MFSYKDKIKKLRKQKKLSQTEFAKETGVSRSYVAQIELGNKTPSIQYLEKIVDVFNMNKKFFFNDDHEEVNIDLIEKNIQLISRNNIDNLDLTPLLETHNMIEEISRIHSEIHKYYQRLIDIKLMNNKLIDNEIEEDLTDFIDRFAITMNTYFNDLFASKGMRMAYPNIPATDIRNLNKQERKDYLVKLYNDRQTFEYVFFNYFQKFYNKYMEDWYKKLSKIK